MGDAGHRTPDIGRQTAEKAKIMGGGHNSFAYHVALGTN